MGERRQAVTYFQFSGGLNTESSLLNIEPQDATDLSNVKLELNGTVRCRRGVDFVGPKDSDGTYYTTDITDCTVDSPVGDFQDPATNSILFTVIDSDNMIREYVIAQVGASIYIYPFVSISDLTNTDEYAFKISPPYNSVRGYHYETKFILDSERVFLINPYLPLSYLSYDKNTDTFSIVEVPVYVRNLSGNPSIDTFVRHNDKIWQCVYPHGVIPNGDSEPGVGSLWQNYWRLYSTETAADSDVPVWANADGTSRISTQHTLFAGPDTDPVTTVYNWICTGTHVSTTSEYNISTDKLQTYWTLESRVWGGVPLYPLWVEGESYFKDTQDTTYTTNIERLDLGGEENPSVGWGTGTFAVGRLWLANNSNYKNRVYFSQTIVDGTEFGRMYQVGDPFNAEDSDIVDTDGGFITITGCTEIYSIEAYRSGVLVFASNGVWFISGDTGIFRTTDYSIEKISEEGVVGRTSTVVVEGGIVFCSRGGINAISIGDTGTTTPLVVSLSNKIQTYWTGIPLHNRKSVKLYYNSDSTEIYILCNIQEQGWSETRNPYYNCVRSRDILIYNVKLKAWSIYNLQEDSEADLITIGDFLIITSSVESRDTIISESLDTVITDTLQEVYVTNNNISKDQIITGVLFIKQNGNYVDFSFGLLSGEALQDFSKNSADTESYDAYIETAPQVYNDIGHRKQTPYLYTAFQTVETGYDIETDQYENSGGCYYRINWDWANATAAAKYGQQYAAYKPHKWNLVYEDGSLPGYEIVRNKHRVRGSGSAVQVRFEREGDKDFHLVGWQLAVTGNPRD